jgi:hypothetical protein
MIIDFTTSKGNFAFIALRDFTKLNKERGVFVVNVDIERKHEIVFSIEKQTEELWQQVLDEYYITGFYSDEYVYKNYLSDDEPTEHSCYTSAIQSSKSLMDSLDIRQADHLNGMYFEGFKVRFKHLEEPDEKRQFWTIIKYL